MAPAKPPRSVRVALTQMRVDQDPAINLRKQLQLIDDAAKKGAQIVCTQELFGSQYFCQVEDHRFFELAEPIPGPTTHVLMDAAKSHGITLIASLFERRAPGLFHNTAVVISEEGALVGRYRKMHIPDDPQYYEKFYFTPGDLGFRAFDTKHAKLGTLVCWDQWFPEAARLTALRGAEILFYPTAIGWLPAEKSEYGAAQHDSWELIQRSHAVANGCFVCAANRTGLEIVSGEDGVPVHADGIEFWGRSFIAGPDGQIIAKASGDQDEVIVADCDLARVEERRTHWPFLRDRRIDAYGALSQRFVDDDG